MKILVAGNPKYGLSKAIYELFPNATFVSRSHNGMDLTRYEDIQKLVEMSLDYDVFLSVSCLWGFKQLEGIKEVSEKWFERDHGQIIAIGSSIDSTLKSTTWLYPAEKKALRAYCRQISQKCNSDTTVRLTYVSPGNLHTPGQDRKHPDMKKLDCNYVASVIKWLLEQPKNVVISELCLDAKK